MSVELILTQTIVGVPELFEFVLPDHVLVSDSFQGAEEGGYDSQLFYVVFPSHLLFDGLEDLSLIFFEEPNVSLFWIVQ